ncbi:type II toxin-antitoxin system HipA family toxin [Orbaceae bacterium ac157xtp]
MAGRKSGNILNVAMNGRLVGYLRKHANGVMRFTYSAQWLSMPGARAISLSLPLRAQPYEGDLVYNFFDNLLPDNQLIRDRIARRFKTATNQPFDLLSSIGMDCIGAIQLYPQIDDTVLPSVKIINAKPLTNQQIAHMLQSYQQAPLGMDSNDNDEFRISLAGAQEKTALLKYHHQWCKPLGATPTSHIMKLPIGNLTHHNIDLSESCENEWLCMHIIKAFGLPVADAELVKFDDQKTIVVKRFDRKWSQDKTWLMRLPQEDFCQALGVPPALKYESDGGPGIKECMDLLLGSSEKQDREVFFKAQILFWLLAAIDGHAKNFSLFIQPNSTYQMTPLYDIISAYPLIESKQLQKQKIKMAMAISGKNKHYNWHSIQCRHFIEMGKKVGLDEAVVKQMMNDLKQQTPQVIEQVKKVLPNTFPSNVSEAIFAGLAKQVQKLP